MSTVPYDESRTAWEEQVKQLLDRREGVEFGLATARGAGTGRELTGAVPYFGR
ncbi:MAG: hypothetical protein QM713_17705 [Arachnia sp.]